MLDAPLSRSMMTESVTRVCEASSSDPGAEVSEQSRRTRAPASMPPRRRAEIDVPQTQRDRYHHDADHRQQEEHVDIGEQVDLVLQRLADPGHRLRSRIGGV